MEPQGLGLRYPARHDSRASEHRRLARLLRLEFEVPNSPVLQPTCRPGEWCRQQPKRHGVTSSDNVAQRHSKWGSLYEQLSKWLPTRLHRRSVRRNSANARVDHRRQWHGPVLKYLKAWRLPVPFPESLPYGARPRPCGLGAAPAHLRWAGRGAGAWQAQQLQTPAVIGR